MAARKLPCRMRGHRLRLHLRPGRMPVAFSDLCLMLELELALGRKADFRRRLERALGAAYREGLDRPVNQP